MASEIRTKHQIHHSWFDVLRELYIAPDHRLKMNEIADRVVMSGSGLTRLIDRMLEAGLINRELSSQDRRIVVAALTEAGIKKIEEILPQYQAWITENFLEGLAEDEMEVVHSVFSRFLSHSEE
ncbi:MAG: MarR family transcriptional regulator [Chloroflexota bacterium]